MINKNTNLIIGDIDSGKTRGVIFSEVPNMVSNNENILFIDPKQEYYNKFKKELDEKGYKSFVINLKNPAESNSYNPLSYPYFLYKNDQKSIAIEMVNSLSREICVTKHDGEMFWEESAADYLSGLILALFNEAKEEEIHLGSIAAMISVGEESVNDSNIMKEYYKNVSPTDPSYMLASTTVFAPRDTKLSIVSTLKTKINLFLLRPDLIELLKGNDFKINEIKEKTAIFIITKPNLNILTNLIINQVASFTKQKQPFTYILDAFHTLPKLNIFEELVEEGVANKTKTIIAIHNLEEVEQKYGKIIFKKIKNTINLDKAKVLIQDIEGKEELPKLKETELKLFDLKKVVK